MPSNESHYAPYVNAVEFAREYFDNDAESLAFTQKVLIVGGVDRQDSN